MKFITFEGCEGSGKTTQIALLHEYLNRKGIKTVRTKEPGGTAIADRIRELVLSSEIKDSMTEFLLITAGRREHVNNFIKPNLVNGISVLSDRFFDSSCVYQGFAKGLATEIMIAMNYYAVGDIQPDLTFLLDIEPQTAIARVAQDNARLHNHYDMKGVEFYQQIRKGFLHIAELFPKRIYVIDASQTERQIALIIQKNVGTLFSSANAL